MNNDADELEKKIKEFEDKNQIAPKKQSSQLKPLGKLLGYGLDLFAHVCVGLFIGIMLDKYFGSKPLFLLICLIISIIAAFRMLIFDKKF